MRIYWSLSASCDAAWNQNGGRPEGATDKTNAEVAAVTHAQSRVRAVPEVSKTIRVVGTIDV